MTFRLVSRSFSDHESNLCSILPSTMSAHAGLKRRSWFASMWCSPTFCEPKWHSWLPFGPKCQAIWCPFQLRPPILPSPWFSDDALLRLGISVWKKFFRSSRGFGHSWLKRTRRPGFNAVLTLLERSGQDGSSNPRCLDPFSACVICVKPPLKNRKLIVECVFTEVLDEAIVKAFMLNPDLHHLVSDKAGERHIAGIWFTYWPFVAPAYPHPARVRGSVLFSIA